MSTKADHSATAALGLRLMTRPYKKPAKDTTPPLSSRARQILQYAHDTAHALLAAFEHAKGAKKGTTTDEAQDLLRSMLVMAGAGLDGMTKQLIRDTLVALSARKDAVGEEFAKFCQRSLRGDSDDELMIVDVKLLGRLFASEQPRQLLLDRYVADLTGSSLQSVAQIRKVLAALALEDSAIGLKLADLKEPFRIRNAIIHEFDINFNHVNRNRQGRARDDMISHTNALLTAAELILNGVEDSL